MGRHELQLVRRRADVDGDEFGADDAAQHLHRFVCRGSDLIGAGIERQAELSRRASRGPSQLPRTKFGL